MKIIVDKDQVIHFTSVGNPTTEAKSRQVPPLIVAIDSTLIDDETAICTVKLKLTETDESNASANTLTRDEGAATFSGSLDLNTATINALSTGQQVWIEITWELAGNVLKTDDARLSIQRAKVTGEEGSPETDQTLSDRADWLYAAILGDGVTITKDQETGTITITVAPASAVDWADVTGKPSTFTPSAHAASHAAAGSDPLTLAQSQITNLTSDLAALSSDLDAISSAISGLALGKIKQVVCAEYQSAAGPFTGQSWTTVMTASITPTHANNRIIVISSGCYNGTTGGQHYGRLCNGATPIMAPATAGTRTGIHGGFRSESSSHMVHMTMIAVNAPSSTAEQTYNSQLTSQQAAHTAYLNRTATDTDGAWIYARAASMLIIIEVAP